MFKSRNIFLKTLSLLLILTFVLINTDVSYADSQNQSSEIEKIQLFTDEDLQRIEDYMNENMNEFDNGDLGIPQVGKVNLDNGDEVEITVLNEIDTEVDTNISPYQSVLPGENRVVSVTKNRTGFLGGSMTTKAGYRALSGSNNIQMKGRYVKVDGVPAQGYKLVERKGYFTSMGPSKVLNVKSYQMVSLAGIHLSSKLNLKLTGGYKKVTTTYDWSQG